jgi:pimeloyl-ACP methyl ester carboxylesterase
MHLRSGLALAAAIVLLGCGRRENRTDANFPVGELSLHLVCEGAGTPAVVLDSGLGNDAAVLAREHPSDVAGMVLVDAMTSDQPTRIWTLIPDAHMQEFRTELRRLPEGIDFDTLTKGLADSKAAHGWFHDKPIVVLTRGKEEAFPGSSDDLKARMLATWYSAQAELPLMSSNRAHVIAKKSGHFIQRDDPALVVAAIREVVASARSRRTINQAAIRAD